MFSVPGVFSVPSSWVFFVPAMGVERSRKRVVCSRSCFSFPDGCFAFPVELGRPRVFFVPAVAGGFVAADEVARKLSSCKEVCE